MAGSYPDITPEGLQVSMFSLTRDWGGVEEVLGILQVFSPDVRYREELMVDNVSYSGVQSWFREPMKGVELLPVCEV